MNSLSNFSKPEVAMYAKSYRDNLSKQQILGTKCTEIFASRVFSWIACLKQVSKNSKLASSSPLTDKIISTIFAHYLIKGARYPRPLDRDLPLSPLSFFRSPFHTYNRTSGCGLHRTEEFFLQERGNDFFRKTPNELFSISFLTKSTKFKRLLKGEFQWISIFNSKYQIPVSFDERLDELNAYLKHLQLPSKNSLLIDVGQVINPEVDRVDGQELKERFLLVQKCIQSHAVDASILFGGVIDFNQEANHLAFLINTSGKITPAAKSFKYLLTQGYYPDLVQVEENLKFLEVDKYPEIFSLKPSQLTVGGKEYTIEMLQKLHKELLAAIEFNLKDSSLASNFYFSFLKNLHPHLGPNHLSLNDLKAIQMIGNAYENLLERLKDPTQDYASFITKIDLIFEEVNLIAQFNSSLDFAKQLESLAKVENIPHSTTLHTSGMNAFSMLVPALYKALKRPFTALTPESLYFEVKLKLQHLKNYMSATQYTAGFSSDKFDAVFVELHPNDVTKNYMRDLEVIKNIPLEKVLARKTPLTLVIDTSTTIFYDEDVKEIVRNYEKAIQEGKIAIVLINSLEKLAQIGLSKYPGGLCVVYASDKHSSLKDLLKKYAKNEPLSREAQSFFKMCLFEKEWVLRYKQHILENTKYFYDLAAERLTGFEGNSFELIKKDSDKTPFLSLHYQTFVNKIFLQLKSKSLSQDEKTRIQECAGTIISTFCRMLAQMENLFLPNRMSFGFSHTNFLDCSTALRMSIGLEPKEVLNQFLDLLTQLDLCLQVDASQLREYAELIYTIAAQDDYTEILQSILKDKIPTSILKIQQNSQNPQEILLEFLNYLEDSVGLTPKPQTSNRGRGTPIRSRASSDQYRGRGRGLRNENLRTQDSAPRGRGYSNSNTRGSRGRANSNFYRN